jgi:hypothetical protein
MKNFISKKFIYWIIGASLFLLITMVFIFIWNFWGTKLSNDISDWGSFGGYFGGMITIIFSFASFTILSYITVKITKQSYLKPKQWEAYEKLIQNQEKLEILASTFAFLVKKIEKEKKEYENKRISSRKLKKFLVAPRMLLEETLIFREIYIFMKLFETRYSHLFDYDFNSKEFIELNNCLQTVNEYCIEVELYLNDLDESEIVKIPPEAPEQSINQFGFLGEKLILNLKKELNQ